MFSVSTFHVFVLSIATSAVAASAQAATSSPTELECPHLPTATSTDAISTMAFDVAAGAPIPYVPYEFSSFPILNWTPIAGSASSFSANTVLSVGVKATDTIQVPVTLATLPGGTVVSSNAPLVNACEYYSVLNGYESYLNDLGMTLRDSTTRYHVRETKITQDELDTWNSQVTAADQATDTSVSAEGVANEVKLAITDRTAELKGQPGLVQGAQDSAEGQTIGNFNVTNGGSFNLEYLHSYRRIGNCPLQEFGFSSKFYASLDCSLALNYWDPNAVKRYDNGVSRSGNYRNQKGYATRVESHLLANGAVFGLDFTILDAGVTARTYHDGSVDAKVTGKVMGFDLYSGAPGRIQRNAVKLSRSGSEDAFNMEESVQATVVIGPVPVSLEVGARGEGGIDFSYGLAGLKTDAGVSSGVFVEGFATVGVDLLVVGASVESFLTIIDDSLEAGGHVAVDFPGGSPTPAIRSMGSIFNEIDVLSGEINLVTWIMVPRLAWAPFTKKEFEYTLFDWEGYVNRGSLFSVDEAFDLYD